MSVYYQASASQLVLDSDGVYIKYIGDDSKYVSYVRGGIIVYFEVGQLPSRKGI